MLILAVGECLPETSWNALEGTKNQTPVSDPDFCSHTGALRNHWRSYLCGTDCKDKTVYHAGDVTVCRIAWNHLLDLDSGVDSCLSGDELEYLETC